MCVFVCGGGECVGAGAVLKLQVGSLCPPLLHES